MSDDSSRIPGFYRMRVDSRRAHLCELSAVDLAELDGGGLDLEIADGMIENVVGTYALPLAVALNFQVNDRDYLVPMAIEEPSVVAAASNAAKMVRESGGFRADVSPPIMIGQVQLTGVANPDAACHKIHQATDELLALGSQHCPGLVTRGGGPVGIETRVLSRPEDIDGGMVVVHLLVDCCDAMGANLVNTIAEAVAPRLAQIAGATIGLRILSNLCTGRTVTIRARVSDAALGGAEVRKSVAAASRFAELDPYRAATHNKGIMNGVDAVLLATGNDWRGVEAGAHAFAAMGGRYAPLATWRDTGEYLQGEMTIPMAVATVGGALQVHRAARFSLRVLGVESANELAQVVAAAGLASNLAALRALATEGIQRGHMSLHARVVARAAGATGEMVDEVARQIAASGDVKPDRAKEVLKRLNRIGSANEVAPDAKDFP